MKSLKDFQISEIGNFEAILETACYNLGQNRWEICARPPPLPLNQGWENGAFWLLHCFILDLSVGGGGLLVGVVSKCTVGLF